MNDDINSIENDQEILEIDDETVMEEGNDLNSNIEKNITDEDVDLDIIDDGLNDKDNFSIEIDDETNDTDEKDK